MLHRSGSKSKTIICAVHPYQLWVEFLSEFFNNSLSASCHNSSTISANCCKKKKKKVPSKFFSVSSCFTSLKMVSALPSTSSEFLNNFALILLPSMYPTYVMSGFRYLCLLIHPVLRTKLVRLCQHPPQVYLQKLGAFMTDLSRWDSFMNLTRWPNFDSSTLFSDSFEESL